MKEFKASLGEACANLEENMDGNNDGQMETGPKMTTPGLIEGMQQILNTNSSRVQGAQDLLEAVKVIIIDTT